MISFRKLLPAILAVAAFCATASSAHAIDKCKVKVDKRTGVIQVDATGVGGTLLWGAQSGSETNSFFNGGTCVSAGKAKRCQIGDPLTLASKTPPTGCTLYLNDGATPCSAWIPGCSPGARRDTGALLKDANGLVIGTVLEPNVYTAVRNESGTLLRLQPQYDGNGFNSQAGLLYTSVDCTGTALMGADVQLIKSVAVHGTTAYYAPTSTSSQNVQSILNLSGGFVNQAACDGYFGPGMTFVAPDGCCQTVAFGSVQVGTAQTIDISVFVTPFEVELQQ